MFDSHLTEKADITKLFKKYNEIKKKKKEVTESEPRERLVSKRGNEKIISREIIDVTVYLIKIWYFN